MEEQEYDDSHGEWRDINPNEDDDDTPNTREIIGKIPMMLRSDHCVLTTMKLDDKGIMDLGECTFDQGGYFIINGSEKVLIAQERMSNNHVYCFKKKEEHKYQWVVECRSQTSGGRPVSTIYMQMYRRITKGGDRQVRCRQGPRAAL